jgi:hypothetical protein
VPEDLQSQTSTPTITSEDDDAPVAHPHEIKSSDAQTHEECAQQDRLTTIPFAPAKESGKPETKVAEAAQEDADPDMDKDKDKDDEDLAKRFMDWLASGIKTTKLDINTAKAMVHTVPDGILIVRAPRKAWRVWSGESPGMERVNHPPLPSVAPLAERYSGYRRLGYL